VALNGDSPHPGGSSRAGGDFAAVIGQDVPVPVRNELTVAEETQLEERLLEMREGQDAPAEEQAAVADRDMEIRRFDDVAMAMKMIMEGNAAELDIEKLEELSRHERDALRLLAEVVRGRRDDGNKFYAEYRLVGLNNVLSILQPVLAVGAMPGFEALRDTFNEIVDMVGDLRDTLDSVDSAEEEKLGLLEPEEAEDEDEDDDDDEGEGEGEGEAGEGGEGEAGGSLTDELAADRRRRAAGEEDEAGDDAPDDAPDDEPAGG